MRVDPENAFAYKKKRVLVFVQRVANVTRPCNRQVNVKKYKCRVNAIGLGAERRSRFLD